MNALSCGLAKRYPDIWFLSYETAKTGQGIRDMFMFGKYYFVLTWFCLRVLVMLKERDIGEANVLNLLIDSSMNTTNILYFL